MTYQNPHMLPKVRSEDLTESANWHKFGIGCTARVSSFIPGHRCSSDETTVFAHYGCLAKERERRPLTSTASSPACTATI